jgi:hypothetical protein
MHELDGLREEISRLTDAVFGNGEPGLKSDMRVLKERFDGLKEATADNGKQLSDIKRILYLGMGGLYVLYVGLKFVPMLIK